jgi:hypothetical protein
MQSPRLDLPVVKSEIQSVFREGLSMKLRTFSNLLNEYTEKIFFIASSSL